MRFLTIGGRDELRQENKMTKKRSTARNVRPKLRERNPKQMAKTQIIKENGKERNLSSITHAAFAIQRAFYANTLDRRSHIGQLVSDMEEQYAAHMGFESFDHCSIVLREKLRLAIGNFLFQMLYTPSESTLPHLRASENTLNRILTELGIKPEPKNVKDLHEYMTEKYGKE